MNDIFRSLYIWSSIGIGTALMYMGALPVFLATAPFDRQRRFGHWYAQRWGRAMLKVNNRWVIQVLGQENIVPGRPYVIVANHQGMGDILLAFCLDVHFKWISKRANFFVPFMGWFMYHAGYIPLVRGRRRSIEECMEKAREYLNEGVSVLFFPEGTRSEDHSIRPFKKGAFKLAIDAGVDILPIAIDGTRDVLPKHSWKFSNDRAQMRMLVGQVISARGMKETDVDQLAEQTRDQIIALREELRARPLA